MKKQAEIKSILSTLTPGQMVKVDYAFGRVRLSSTGYLYRIGNKLIRINSNITNGSLEDGLFLSIKDVTDIQSITIQEPNT